MKARQHFGLLFLLFACAANGSGQVARSRVFHRATLPGKDWSVDVSLAPFTVELEEFSKEDGSYLLFATQHSGNFASTPLSMMSIRLEAAKVKGSDTDFRDFAVKMLKKSGRVEGVSVRTFEYKQIPAIRYKLTNPLTGVSLPYPTLQGPLARGMEAFFVRDDVWITLRLYAVEFKKEDEQFFYNVLDSVKFTDTSHPSSSFDYFYKAKAHLVQKQYAQAAKDFNTALNLEREQRQLDDTHWRNLIGHLVDLSIAAGERVRAKELLEYGISQDPTFPLFHVALAHYYVSQGDVVNTVAALEKAYQYRKNDKRTASWYDPMKDPAFERFRKDETFRKATKAMKR